MATSTPDQTLRRLSVVVTIQWMGATLGLPLLPLFLEHRGGSPTVIGFIMSAFFLAGVATQFVMGRLTDLYGRRIIMVGSLLLYAMASMTYVLPVAVPWLAIARALQGVSAGAIEMASLSAVSGLFPEAQRGRAISKIFAAQLLGIAIGPMAGLLATVNDLGWAFAVTGLVSIVSAIVAYNTNLGAHERTTEKLPPLQWSHQLIGSLVGAASIGLVIGVYETCWSLLMKNHHATLLEVRLSWTLFCLPWVLLSRYGGWLADHANRKYIGIAGMFNAAIFLSIYPHIHNVVVMLFAGSLEAIGASLTMPSISSLTTQGAHDREQGRRQGLYATANTATIAVATVISGALFNVSPSLPFTVVAVASFSISLTTFYWWRNTRGRISQ